MQISQGPSSSSSGTVSETQRQHFGSVSSPFPRTWTPQPDIGFLPEQVSADRFSRMSGTWDARSNRCRSTPRPQS
jgi:hypothetical protein